MTVDFEHIRASFAGTFLTNPEAIQEKLLKVKAYIFDWDGVFNDGMKDENGSSPFSEVDSMGTNLLRFNHHLRKGSIPLAAVITGETNNAAFSFAKREHFHAVYFGVKNKKEALTHLCSSSGIEPGEVCFFFDDVLDFSVAEVCGLRVMVRRTCNPLLIGYAQKNGLVDYLTANNGSNHALRECSELLTGLSERYDETIAGRVSYSEQYLNYITERNVQPTSFYTVVNSQIKEADK